LPNPCAIREEKEISATPIVVEGVTYYYVEDIGDINGYKIYESRDDLGGFAEVAPDQIDGILAAIAAAN
jgi:hypothetical protein